MDASGGRLLLVGLDLRYVLTWHLVEAGSIVSLGELVRSVEADGFVIAGRVGKTASDALRWEIGRGRVVRVSRGVYRPGSMPRQTKSRIRLRAMELRRQAVAARWDMATTGAQLLWPQPA